MAFRVSMGPTTMYPSGHWRAFWQQAGYGRQEMSDLRLDFRDGTITGQGIDCVGLFTFSGTYDDQGSIVMIKQYVGKHRVLYHGKYDGEGSIHGNWTVEGIAFGPFAMTPLRGEDAGDRPIQEIR